MGGERGRNCDQLHSPQPILNPKPSPPSNTYHSQRRGHPPSKYRPDRLGDAAGGVSRGRSGLGADVQVTPLGEEGLLGVHVSGAVTLVAEVNLVGGRGQREKRAGRD